MRGRGTGHHDRSWAWPSLATIVVGLGCVGLPPPPPSELTTSTTGDAMLATTVGSASATGPTETTGLGASETGQASESSTTVAGECIDDSACMPGQACEDGECVACPTPRCDACPSGTCECPDEPCCDVGTCVLPRCDPFLQNCASGEGCYFLGEDWSCVPDASGDVGGYGSACEAINVCDPGFVCIDANALPGCMGMLGCCSPICDVIVGSAQCPGAADGEVCIGLYQPGTAPPGLENVGVCGIPTMM